jgi:hypothetical protein
MPSTSRRPPAGNPSSTAGEYAITTTGTSSRRQGHRALHRGRGRRSPIWPRRWPNAGGADADAIQTEVYEVGKRHPFADLKAWFQGLYEVLLGQSQGPRMGSFIALYGVKETIELIRKALAGEDLGA